MTDFGALQVPVSRKADLVGAVFESVSGRYDLMNDLMSFGMHRTWKAALLDWLAPGPDMRLLDVAGGTGDIAAGFLARGGRGATVCDINPAMIQVGRARQQRKGMPNLNWVCGDAEALPVPDRSVDAYSIAFGLRNVTRIDAALREAQRVLRTGGRFLCLEFSRPAIAALAPLYDRYCDRVLPALGQRVAGDRDAYVYLVESIRRFPDQDNLVRRIEASGLRRVRYRNLSGGIVALHSAWRF